MRPAHLFSQTTPRAAARSPTPTPPFAHTTGSLATERFQIETHGIVGRMGRPEEEKSPPLNADRMVERLLLRRKHSRPLSTRQR